MTRVNVNVNVVFSRSLKTIFVDDVIIGIRVTRQLRGSYETDWCRYVPALPALSHSRKTDEHTTRTSARRIGISVDKSVDTRNRPGHNVHSVVSVRDLRHLRSFVLSPQSWRRLDDGEAIAAGVMRLGTTSLQLSTMRG